MPDADVIFSLRKRAVRFVMPNVRRAVVTDVEGKCCGMVAQANVARGAQKPGTAVRKSRSR